MQESIVLGKIYFEELGGQAGYREDILGIHTGCNIDTFGNFMDLFTECRVIRYYPYADGSLGKYFEVDTKDYDPNKILMYPDKNEIFTVKRVDLFGGLRMLNKVDVVNDYGRREDGIQPTNEWCQSKINDLEAELSMTRVLLKLATEKLVSNGIVAG